jgi:Glyoxalase-like domain
LKKFINHVDHVAYISKPENLEANVAQLEKLSGAKLTKFARKDMGFTMCISWEAGLEVVAPMPEPTEFNKMLHDWLQTRGEGVMSVVFGVRGLDKHKARLEAQGIEVGPLMDDHPDSPWHQKLVLWERMAGLVMNSGFILGDIDYAEGVIPFVDA